ncbi:MAG TPA: hypothetical protein VJR47_19470 [Stellaceae bacterium]|nr:hypothetical protein [Stellaceae bacterium]
MIPPLGLFIPTWPDLAGWLGAFFACLVFIGLGRLVTAGRAAPEAALIGGWGASAFILTLWGLATQASLRFPAWALAALGLAALLAPRLRLARADWRALARVIVLALPLIALMASARPSLPDTWLNLLPNAAYLYDHGFFPADARPAAHSFIAGAPYNMQLAAFVASLVTPDFPPAAMIDLNLLLQLAAALLLARLVAQGGHETKAPSWSGTAFGILLATLLNPGFDPRYHLSAYSEPSVTVTVAFAGWFAARALDRMNSGRRAAFDVWMLALTLTALVNIKQESILLVAGILAAAFALAATARSQRARSIAAVIAAALPCLALYLLWRWYVLAHFAIGELKNLPLAQWHVAALPQILLSMLHTVANKGVFFAILLAAIVVALARAKARRFDLATRLGLMLAGTAIVYNLGLLLAYVAHFEGEMGIGAHSYFRYNTHLSLLLMAAIALMLQPWSPPRLVPGWRRALPVLAVVLVLLDPFPFAGLLRFDLEVPNLRVARLAKGAVPLLASEEKLVLVLPGDNGSVAPALETLLRDVPPRRPELELRVARDLDAASGMTGYDHALLSCRRPQDGGGPQGSAQLLKRTPSGWAVEASWPYDAAPTHARWSQVLAPAALCLGG